jgi:hypothetical protein
MTLKLKSLLEQQTTTPSDDAAAKSLAAILQTQRDIFKNMSKQLGQLDYVGIDAETEKYVLNNPVALCDAYIAYCDATLAAIRLYASQNYSQADLAGEAAPTFYNNVKFALTYH